MASSLEEIQKTLATLLNRNESEQVRNEMRDKLVHIVQNIEPDSDVGKAWKKILGEAFHEPSADVVHKFEKMLTSSLPIAETPKPKPEPKPPNYESVMHRLAIQFASLSLHPIRPTPQNKHEKDNSMAGLVRTEMMQKMRENPRIAAEFLSSKAEEKTHRELAIGLFNDLKEAAKEDKVAMSAMLLGLKANPLGATLLGGTGQDLGAPISDLQGSIVEVHKPAAHFKQKTEEKLHETTSLQGVLKQVLQTVGHAIKELEAAATHRAPTPFSTVPKPKE